MTVLQFCNGFFSQKSGGMIVSIKKNKDEKGFAANRDDNDDEKAFLLMPTEMTMMM